MLPVLFDEFRTVFFIDWLAANDGGVYVLEINCYNAVTVWTVSIDLWPCSADALSGRPIVVSREAAVLHEGLWRLILGHVTWRQSAARMHDSVNAALWYENYEQRRNNERCPRMQHVAERQQQSTDYSRCVVLLAAKLTGFHFITCSCVAVAWWKSTF